MYGKNIIYNWQVLALARPTAHYSFSYFNNATVGGTAKFGNPVVSLAMLNKNNPPSPISHPKMSPLFTAGASKAAFLISWIDTDRQSLQGYSYVNFHISIYDLQISVTLCWFVHGKNLEEILSRCKCSKDYFNIFPSLPLSKGYKSCCDIP